MTVQDHDLGLCADFPLVRRRRLLGLVRGTTVAALAGAGTRAILEESAGPYPANGAGGPGLLLTSGIVRQDIRRSFGKARGVAKGVPLTIRLQLVIAATGEPAAGRAVYLWHCDQDGLYSLYSEGLTAENYLRGVQASDSAGRVTFTSIVPGACAGRPPHLNLEIYPSVAEAGDPRNKLHAAQVELPSSTGAPMTAGFTVSV